MSHHTYHFSAQVKHSGIVNNHKAKAKQQEHQVHGASIGRMFLPMEEGSHVSRYETFKTHKKVV